MEPKRERAVDFGRFRPRRRVQQRAKFLIAKSPPRAAFARQVGDRFLERPRLSANEATVFARYAEGVLRPRRQRVVSHRVFVRRGRVHFERGAKRFQADGLGG